MSTRRRKFLAVAFTCLGLFLVLAVMAKEQCVSEADVAAQTFVRSLDFRPLERAMQGLSSLGSGYCLVPMTLIVFLLLRRTHPSVAVAVPSLLAGAAIVQAACKWAVARPRPSLEAYGFPSGHVFVSVAFFGTMVYVLWLLEEHPFWRWTGTSFCVSATLGIGLSRLYLNSHWLTDVLGALAGGTSYLLFALALVGNRLGADATPPSRSGRGRAG